MNCYSSSAANVPHYAPCNLTYCKECIYAFTQTTARGQTIYRCDINRIRYGMGSMSDIITLEDDFCSKGVKHC